MTINGAIMQLVEMRENSMMPMVFKPYFDKVIETISECEEPHSQPQWILCSERLPKYGQPVLTYNLEDDEYEVNHIIDEEDGEWFTYGVDAWMPLPEPYKEGKE